MSVAVKSCAKNGYAECDDCHCSNSTADIFAVYAELPDGQPLQALCPACYEKHMGTPPRWPSE